MEDKIYYKIEKYFYNQVNDYVIVIYSDNKIISVSNNNYSWLFIYKLDTKTLSISLSVQWDLLELNLNKEYFNSVFEYLIKKHFGFNIKKTI